MKSKSFFNRLFVKISSMAVLGVLLSLMFAASVFAAPKAPTGLRQTNSNWSSASFEWNAVMGTKVHYQIDYSLDNKSWIKKVTGYHSLPSDILFGLNKGKTYYIRVRAYEYKSIPSYVESDYSPWSASLQVATDPDPSYASRAYQTQAASTAISFTWNKAEGANRYRVCLYENGNETKTWYTGTNSITIGGLKAGESYRFKIYAQNVIAGYTAESSAYGITDDMKTLPGTVRNFKLDYGLPYSNKAYVTWDRITNANGYQIEIYNSKNKRIRTVTTNTYNSYGASSITNTGFHKIRIRGFVQLKSGKKYGSTWATTYISNQPQVSRRKSGSYIKASWKRVTGATSYSVYISTKQKSGYKLAGTTKSTSFTIKKYGKSKLKKGRNYYIYTVSNKKVGSKTYKSGSTYTFPVRM